ncbi:MAG: DNA primase [Lachnospiraceae bacterium]|nr:DNA primase [Candidatus Merdinaster equi]
MYYPEELVEEVRSRNDIVDIISGYVRLKRQGSNYVGLCPFHNDKSPSFYVSLPKQIYKCFACGAGGNVFTFIKEYENYTFPEAVKFLADKAGIALPEASEDPGYKSRESKKQKLLEINKLAATYYYKMLRSPSGEVGLKYLKGRELSDETMKSFGLGFAGIHNNEMVSYLKKEGYSDQLIQESGLVSFEEKRGMYDKFWNRVMFPIMDINHRVIGFGGRVMGDGKPKYLNSPETPIFDKGRNLYALNIARTAKRDHIVLCEGYMDVISMHQAGFTQAVASLGTALTSGQASLLKRYTNQVILSYDSDEAGVKAALRAIPILKAAGISAKVLNLSPYKDPDEFIKAKGAESFEERLRNAENGIFFQVRVSQERHDMDDPDSRTEFQKEVVTILCSLTDELERDNYISAISERFAINSTILKTKVNEMSAKLAGQDPYVAPKETTVRKKAEDPSLHEQRLLVTWLVDEPDIWVKIKRYVDIDDFSNPVYRKTAEYVIDDLENGRWNPAAIISRFEDEEEQKEVTSLFSTTLPEINTTQEKQQAIKDILYKIKEFSFEKYREENGTDITKMQQLIEKKKQLEAFKKITILLN